MSIHLLFFCALLGVSLGCPPPNGTDTAPFFYICSRDHSQELHISGMVIRDADGHENYPVLFQGELNFEFSLTSASQAVNLKTAVRIFQFQEKSCQWKNMNAGFAVSMLSSSRVIPGPAGSGKVQVKINLSPVQGLIMLMIKKGYYQLQIQLTDPQTNAELLCVTAQAKAVVQKEIS